MTRGSTSGSTSSGIRSAHPWATLLSRLCRFSALGRIRTCDRRIRSPLLYPAELRGPWRTVEDARPELPARELWPPLARVPARHGGRSSARLERQVVALEVGGSNPLGHPTCPAHGGHSALVRGTAMLTNRPGSARAHAPLAQLAEHRTLNPQVLGSSPRGRTGSGPGHRLVGVRFWRFRPGQGRRPPLWAFLPVDVALCDHGGRLKVRLSPGSWWSPSKVCCST